jgi:hypothetical protein
VLEKAMVVAAAKGLSLSSDCLDLPSISEMNANPGEIDLDDIEVDLDYQDDVSVDLDYQDDFPVEPDHQDDVVEKLPRKGLGGKPKKLSTEQLEHLFFYYIDQEGWTRARLAKALGVHSSTLKKWFKAAGLPAGKSGRPKKKKPDFEADFDEIASEPTIEIVSDIIE